MKKFNQLVVIYLFLFLGSSCETKKFDKPDLEQVVIKESIQEPKEAAKFINTFEDDTNFINVAVLSPTILQEIRYADTNNFTGLKIYQCPSCFLQNEVAHALELANNLAQLEGYRLKVFDCYRAFDYQVMLYEAFPNFNYVAKPSKGSMHSYGCAVDITLTDEFGNELDMGTAFDSFDKKSYTNNLDIDSSAIRNRIQLKTIMNQAGFSEIKTEWWHFSFAACNKRVNTNLKWSCP